MPRKSTIDKHPRKEEIIKDLVEGKPYREIAAKYGVSTTALTRYRNNHIPKQVAKAEKKQERQEKKDIAWVQAQISKFLERNWMLSDACDEWLRDPRNPDKYYLGPRAFEVEVVYEVTEWVGDQEKTRREVDTLQNLLDKKKTGVVPLEVRSKHADPRELLHKLSTASVKQLELMVKINEQILEQMQNLAEKLVLSPRVMEKDERVVKEGK